jgi:hypothetical protein
MPDIAVEDFQAEAKSVAAAQRIFRSAFECQTMLGPAAAVLPDCTVITNQTHINASVNNVQAGRHAFQQRDFDAHSRTTKQHRQ